MTCTEFIALLDDLIDDTAAAETRAELQKHLSGCEHCEVTLNTTRKTIEIYRSHELYDLPPRPPRTPPRRHHGPLQKRLLKASSATFSSVSLESRLGCPTFAAHLFLRL